MQGCFGTIPRHEIADLHVRGTLASPCPAPQVSIDAQRGIELMAPRKKTVSSGNPLNEVADQIGMPAWAKLLVWGLAIILTWAVFGSWWAYSRISKLESAVRVINSAQPTTTKDLVRELLAQAEVSIKANNTQRAEKALNVLPVFIAAAREKRVPADPRYFEDSVAALNRISQSVPTSIEAKADTHRALVELASYRSNVEPAPDLSEALSGAYEIKHTEPFNPRTHVFQRRDGSLVIDARAVPTQENFLDVNSGHHVLIRDPETGAYPDFPERYKNGLRKALVIGGGQDLDNTYWANVVFVNVTIRYSGGPLELHGVRFVNCDFRVPGDQPRTDKFAEFVALQEPTLRLAD